MLLRQRDQTAGSRRTLGQRFFGIDVLSGQNGGFIDGFVQKMGRTVMDGVYLRVGDHLPPVGIDLLHMVAFRRGPRRRLVRVADGV